MKIKKRENENDVVFRNELNCEKTYSLKYFKIETRYKQKGFKKKS